MVITSSGCGFRLAKGVNCRGRTISHKADLAVSYENSVNGTRSADALGLCITETIHASSPLLKLPALFKNTELS